MKVYYYFLAFLFSVQILVAQEKTTNPNAVVKDTIAQKNDSVNSALLSNYNSKLKELDVQRKKDSVKQAELKKKLQSLSTTDNIKKEQLLKKLDELANKDKQRLLFKKKQIDSLRHTAKSYPVFGFFKDTLFVIYNKLGSFSANDRAKAISERVHKMADIYGFKEDSLQIIENETTVDIQLAEEIVLSISENDALWNNSNKVDLAKKYKSIIAKSVLKYQSETSFETLSKDVGLALLVLIFVGILVFFIKKGFRILNSKITDEEGKKLKGITLKNYTLFDAKSQVKVFLMLSNFLKWILIIITIYLALPVLFGIFPWTKHFTYSLIEYVKSPTLKIIIGVWNYLPNLITIIIIALVFKYVMRFIYFLKTEIENENLKISGFYPDWANPTYQIIKVIMFAFMGIVIFPYLPGSDSPIFQGVSVFLGVLFTFGSSGSLSNVVAGLVLTYMRLFKIGDRVKIGDVIGNVIEKSMLVTRVRTIKNEIISIPNSSVMNSHTINYSSDAPTNGLILHTTITIGYDVPWKKMHQTLIDAANRTEMILESPAPFVLQTSLDDFYVSYQINGYTKDENKQAAIYSQLHANIQDCCNENGIEILSPHYRAGRDGNQITIPEEYLDKNYVAPKFNINLSKE